MKKIAVLLAVALMATMILSVSAFAYDDIQLVGTNKAPTIDGVLDDCYMKIHDFYAPNPDEWYDANDPDHLSQGEAWGTWDADNFYCFFKVKESSYEPGNYEGETPGSNYSSMYLALLATLPVDDLPEDDYYVMQCSLNRSADNTKEWKYTGSVVEEYRYNSADLGIYDSCPFDFETINDGTYTYYEIKMPWNQIDRTGNVKFEAGHKWFFNYIITWNNDGEFPIVQYGQGLMNDVYDMGGEVTLVPAVEEETAAPETAAPETAAPAAEAAPAAAAPAETAAPAAEAAPAAAPVAAAAPAAPAAAAQTGDAAAIAVLAAVAALGTAVVVGKKH